MNNEIKLPPALPTAGTEYCPIHPHNSAMGHCRRCKQPYCDACECRWDKEILCLACVTKVLESDEATPGDKRKQKREGVASLVLAVIGWVMFVGSLWMFWNICDGKGDKNLAIINVVLFLASFIAPLVGLGMAAATLRSRGPALRVATWGLVLAGLQIGVTLSLVALNITHN